jgi:integrase
MPLKLKKYPSRSNHWYIRGTVRGQAVFETTGTDIKSAAEDFRITREKELLDRSVFGAGATTGFLQAAVSYLEAGGEGRYLGKRDPNTGQWSLLIGHFGNTMLSRIRQAEVDAAATKLYPGTSTATRKRQVYVPMTAVLNHAAAKEWCPHVKIKAPKVVEKTPQWATPEYVGKLLSHCAPRLRRFVLISVYTGARLSEVAMKLSWEDIDLEQRLITFRRTKNGEMRTAHMGDPVYEDLSKVPQAQRKGRLFIWSHKSNVRRPLMTAAKNAGLPYLSPHQLGRHTFATWLRIYAKRDLRGLKDDGGWKSISSVARYAHTVPGETATAVDLLPRATELFQPGQKLIKDRRVRVRRA